MLSADSIANIVERGAKEQLDSYTALRVVEVSKSLVSGRRYIGLSHEDGRQFLVQIDVDEVPKRA